MKPVTRTSFTTPSIITVCVDVSDTNAIEAVVLVVNGGKNSLRQTGTWLGWRFEDRYPRSRALEGDAILGDKQVLLVGARTDTHRGAGRRAIDRGLNGLPGHHLNGARRVRGRSSDPGEDETYRELRHKEQTHALLITKIRNMIIPPIILFTDSCLFMS